MLTPAQKSVLNILEQTLIMIKGDYPAASPEYKRSSFVIGAQDMAEQFVKGEPFEVKREFAKEVDRIRIKHFPQPCSGPVRLFLITCGPETKKNVIQIKRKFLIRATNEEDAARMFTEKCVFERSAGEPLIQSDWKITYQPVEFVENLFEI